MSNMQYAAIFWAGLLTILTLAYALGARIVRRKPAAPADEWAGVLGAEPSTPQKEGLMYYRLIPTQKEFEVTEELDRAHRLMATMRRPE